MLRQNGPHVFTWNDALTTSTRLDKHGEHGGSLPLLFYKRVSEHTVGNITYSNDPYDVRYSTFTDQTDIITTFIQNMSLFYSNDCKQRSCKQTPYSLKFQNRGWSVLASFFVYTFERLHFCSPILNYFVVVHLLC